MTLALPQLQRTFITDAGLETEMVFIRKIDLPCFSSTTLLAHDEGRAALDDYFNAYVDLARTKKVGCILETPSWRASSDWAERIGLSDDELDEANREAVALVQAIAEANRDVDVIVSGCVGPRGDGYNPGFAMTADEAQAYHRPQVATLADAGADVITAITMTNVAEAIGIVRAARSVGKPVVISFTLETDGKLPTGDTLAEAIRTVDAATDAYPAYFMINCAHPSHFDHAIPTGAEWSKRILGLRANASCKSHAELDEMEVLDDGNPDELGRQYRELHSKLPNLKVLGGCCGTDIRHVTAIADHCIA